MPEPYYQDEKRNIFIYHNDCREVLPQIQETADFLLTDPPYGVSYDASRIREFKQGIAGDDNLNWMEEVWPLVYTAQKPDTLAVSFYGFNHADKFVSAWRVAGYRIAGHLAFVKNCQGLGYYARSKHETAYLLSKGKPPRPAKAPADVFPWTRVVKHVHPTEKPINALIPCIEAYCPPSGIVLDPFMGSGSILEASLHVGLGAIGIELEERYCELAARRLMAFSLAEAA